MSNIYIHQIYYDDASKAQLDAGFLPLDNSKNERPDWYEYHPIRTFLLSHALEDDAYYGFFSARFKSKTNLTANDVEAFVKANDGADIVLFSPFFSESAFFLSVFEQGECRHSGLMQAGQEFAQSIGMDTNLSGIVTESTNTVFANYFVAKRPFWTAWFQLAEGLYRRAEEASPESIALVKPAAYPRPRTAELKVFIMERLATLLLATSDGFKAAVYDPTALSSADPVFSRFPREAVICDALKLAYRRFGNRRYIDEFIAIRNSVFEGKGCF